MAQHCNESVSCELFFYKCEKTVSFCLRFFINKAASVLVVLMWYHEMAKLSIVCVAGRESHWDPLSEFASGFD